MLARKANMDDPDQTFFRSSLIWVWLVFLGFCGRTLLIKIWNNYGYGSFFMTLMLNDLSCLKGESRVGIFYEEI